MPNKEGINYYNNIKTSMKHSNKNRKQYQFHGPTCLNKKEVTIFWLIIGKVISFMRKKKKFE